MLSKEIVTKITDQLNFELHSAYLYLDISNYYANNNLDGFANWFMIQTQEERDHAMLFMHYLLNNGAEVKLQDVKASNPRFEDFRSPIDAAFNHELKVTASINDIYACAHEQKDYRTMQFLDWFIKEQGEEEKSTEDMLKRYDLFGHDPKGLYLLDTELGARVYSAPSLVL